MLKRLIILILLIKLGVGLPLAVHFSNSYDDCLHILSSPIAGQIADMCQPALEKVDFFIADFLKGSNFLSNRDLQNYHPRHFEDNLRSS